MNNIASNCFLAIAFGCIFFFLFRDLPKFFDSEPIEKSTIGMIVLQIIIFINSIMIYKLNKWGYILWVTLPLLAKGVDYLLHGYSSDNLMGYLIVYAIMCALPSILLSMKKDGVSGWQLLFCQSKEK